MVRCGRRAQTCSGQGTGCRGPGVAGVSPRGSLSLRGCLFAGLPLGISLQGFLSVDLSPRMSPWGSLSLGVSLPGGLSLPSLSLCGSLRGSLSVGLSARVSTPGSLSRSLSPRVSLPGPLPLQVSLSPCGSLSPSAGLSPRGSLSLRGSLPGGLRPRRGWGGRWALAG